MTIEPSAPVHGEEEKQAIVRASETWGRNHGEHSIAFENQLSEYLDAKHVTLVNSGSSANFAALMAMTSEMVPENRRLNQGDEVITAAMGFPTTVSPIIYAGAVPVFVDVEKGTGNINPEQVREMITDKTKVIMVAHTLGNPFNIDEIRDICEEHELTLIEDNCDALGSEWNSKRTGTFGHIGTSSFYPAHHISTGEGGAVYTNNAILSRAIKSMVSWGRDCFCGPAQDNVCGHRYDQQHGDLPHGYDHKNTYTNFGFNFKMVDIQAAIGVEQMKRLDGFTTARRYNHDYITEVFSQYKDWFVLPEVYEGANPSWFGYIVEVAEDAPFTKRELELFLDEAGIKSRALFCGNITKQPVLSSGRFEYKAHPDLSVSDRMMENAFWIGVHPAIGEREREYMKEQITNFMSEYL